MPVVARTRFVAGPPFPLSWERREYRSPDQRWTLVYHTPREWHIGADGWRVKLLHHGWNSWSHRRRLSRLAGPRGFRCDDDVQPWSRDSRAVALLTWDTHPVHLYDVAAKRSHQVPCRFDFVCSLQWSPGVDRLLIASQSAAMLVDRSGVERGSATWRISHGERPYTNWTTDGQWFFVLARESASAKVTLTFHAADGGTVGEVYELDPLDLVPYDAERFAGLPRDRLCLTVSSSMGAAGQLLDTWHSARFHQPSGTLYLAVYRPVSSEVEAEGEGLCRVEERWVAVELAAR